MNILKRCYLILLAFTALALPTLTHADFRRVEQNDASVAYTGTWHTMQSATVSGGSVAYSGVEGARATITFVGTGIRWISYGCQCAPGRARVYLDGVLQLTTGPVPGWADTEPKLQKFGIGGLAHGTHTLTIEVNNEIPDGWYSRGPIVVDAFYVETAAITQLLEENDVSITYTGTWTDIDDPSVSGGSVLASREPGATATVRFNGTAISWIGYKCPCTGTAFATLDGFTRYTIDTTSAERQAQAIVHNLYDFRSGAHELKIEVAGTPAANPWVVVDAFRVQSSTDGPDTTPPEVTMRAPAQGQTIYGTITLHADIFDNRLDAGPRQFYVDGVATSVTRIGAPLPTYLWDTRTVSDGSHTLEVLARDSAGNEARSAPVTVVVDNATDRTGPQVSMTSPANNSQVTGNVTLSADATDASGVTRVEFYYATSPNTVALIGEDTTAPFAITRNTSSIPSGRSFMLYAYAYDAAGNMNMSNGVSVTVQHSP
jgi:hypothetical protein